jgi:hypothetical protein
MIVNLPTRSIAVRVHFDQCKERILIGDTRADETLEVQNHLGRRGAAESWPLFDASDAEFDRCHSTFMQSA